MTSRVKAVYQGGALRPTTPLDLKEGEVVEVTVDAVATPHASPHAPLVGKGKPTLSDAEALQRIQQATTLDELFTALEQAPDTTEEGYDLCESLNENRRLSGETRLLFPPEMKGITW